MGGAALSPTPSGSSSVPTPRRPGASVQLLAAALGVLPLYASLMLYQLRRGQPPSVEGLAVYLAVIAPLGVAIALLLLRFLCGEKPRDLDRGPGTLASDLRATVILAAVILVANVIANGVLSGLLPDSSGARLGGLFAELAGSAGLLVLFLGLLIPLGALSEEVIRVFLLSRLWAVWPSAAGKAAAVIVSACLFGLIHAYRGPVTVAWAAVFGLIMALHYLRFGRVVPLILAHYLTNALQLAVAAAQAS